MHVKRWAEEKAKVVLYGVHTCGTKYLTFLPLCVWVAENVYKSLLAKGP